MSILNPTTELTTAQKQNRAAQAIQSQAANLFANMGRTYEQISNIVFNNPQGLTPQEVLDALGTNAAELLSLSDLLVQTVNAAAPGTITPGYPVTLTANPDGTVTVS